MFANATYDILLDLAGLAPTHPRPVWVGRGPSLGAATHTRSTIHATAVNRESNLNGNRACWHQVRQPGVRAAPRSGTRTGHHPGQWRPPPTHTPPLPPPPPLRSQKCGVSSCSRGRPGLTRGPRALGNDLAAAMDIARTDTDRHCVFCTATRRHNPQEFRFVARRLSTEIADEAPQPRSRVVTTSTTSTITKPTMATNAVRCVRAGVCVLGASFACTAAQGRPTCWRAGVLACRCRGWRAALATSCSSFTWVASRAPQILRLEDGKNRGGADRNSGC